ncbi:hypothetical protein RclHR1_21780001, partial [Rhizophagus clarus]
NNLPDKGKKNIKFLQAFSVAILLQANFTAFSYPFLLASHLSLIGFSTLNIR